MLKQELKRPILLVEDDSSMGFLLVDFLEASGFKVTLCTDGLQGKQAFEKELYSLCLLDVMLPVMDGFTLAQELRKTRPDVPIIFLTARGMKPDKLKGFQLGADDYVTKPFDEEELLCRIHSVLNRSGNALVEVLKNESVFGDYLYNWDNQSLSYQGNLIKRLTRKESEVLRLLCLNRNKLLRREEILLNIWGENDYFHGRSLDVFIAKLRKYLKDDARIAIENVPSVGFIFSVSE